MTLATNIYVTTPIPYMDVFDKAWELVGGSREIHEWTDDEITYRGQGTRAVRARPMQGLQALLWMEYRLEDDIPCPCEGYEDEYEENHVHAPKAPILVTYDTPYGYRGPNGGGCSDLHAWLITELGKWLDSKGADWWWMDEFKGTYHHRYHHVNEFGRIELGSLAVNSG